MTYETIKQIGRKYLAPVLIGAALVLNSGYDARAEQVEITQPAGIEKVVEKSENKSLFESPLFIIPTFFGAGVMIGFTAGLAVFGSRRNE